MQNYKLEREVKKTELTGRSPLRRHYSPHWTVVPSKKKKKNIAVHSAFFMYVDCMTASCSSSTGEIFKKKRKPEV